ncbi:MAG TPA: dihydrofolate reductase family protein [Ktedonobacteraceae bacterium]
MRKLVASMLMTLDGVVENPQRWTVPFRSEESQTYKFEELFASDALLLGRITYQGLAAAWPGAPGAYGERINRMPKYVPTTTLQEAEWNATLIQDHVGEEVTRWKQESGQDLLIFGSVELIHSLMQEDLIDEYRLMVFPIVVGNGKRLFPAESQQKAFTLVQAQTFGSGVVVLTYEPHRKERGSEGGMKCLHHPEEIMPPHLKSHVSELERRAVLVPSFFMYKIPMAEAR